MTRQETAQQIADQLKSINDKWGDKKFPRAKVWMAGDKVRVYTGHGSEFLEVADSGVSRGKVNMTWGGDIDDVIDGVTV
jgi:hypothetical protein